MARLTEGRRQKYGARAVSVDGFWFASTAEARRYGELILLERAGKIVELRPQVRFPLHAPSNLAGRVTKIGVYIADFTYREHYGAGLHGPVIVEDVKGVKTSLYRWKKRHVEAEHGVTIRELTVGRERWTTAEVEGRERHG